MRIDACSLVPLARLAPTKPSTYKHATAKSEMASQLPHNSLYNSANTKRYLAEALAVSRLVAGRAAVWLYLRGGNHERDATSHASVHVMPTTTELALQGSSAVQRSARGWIFNLVTMIKEMRSAQPDLCLAIPIAASCGFPRLLRAEVPIKRGDRAV